MLLTVRLQTNDTMKFHCQIVAFLDGYKSGRETQAIAVDQTLTYANCLTCSRGCKCFFKVSQSVHVLVQNEIFQHLFIPLLAWIWNIK